MSWILLLTFPLTRSTYPISPSGPGSGTIRITRSQDLNLIFIPLFLLRTSTLPRSNHLSILDTFMTHMAPTTLIHTMPMIFHRLFHLWVATQETCYLGVMTRP